MKALFRTVIFGVMSLCNLWHNAICIVIVERHSHVYRNGSTNHLDQLKSCTISNWQTNSLRIDLPKGGSSYSKQMVNPYTQLSQGQSVVKPKTPLQNTLVGYVNSKQTTSTVTRNGVKIKSVSRL